CGAEYSNDARYCSQCGDRAALPIQTSPPSGDADQSVTNGVTQGSENPSLKGLLVVVAVMLLAIFVVVATGLVGNGSGGSAPQPNAATSSTLAKATADLLELDDFIVSFGKPDLDDNTAYDVPRPPIVTRWVEYRPANVKIVGFPVVKVGTPPPYLRWKVLGFVDISTDT